MKRRSFISKASGWLADSFLFRGAQHLWQLNKLDWNLRLTKLQKLYCGIYLVLKDYSLGHFPPTFEDRAAAYQAEIDYMQTLKGVSVDEARESGLRKPFWYGKASGIYLRDFSRLISDLERLGVSAGGTLLELGSGGGWMAEFLALTGFDVTGTSISNSEILDAQRRVESMRVRGLPPNLRFECWPMEEVGQQAHLIRRFDAVVVFEALHHAFAWREAIASAYAAVKPGGWFLICAEPNLVHTFDSYRVAKLSNTHEVGFSRGELLRYLRHTGFTETRILRNRLSFLTLSHWIAARKAPS